MISNPDYTFLSRNVLTTWSLKWLCPYDEFWLLKGVGLYAIWSPLAYALWYTWGQNKQKKRGNSFSNSHLYTSLHIMSSQSNAMCLSVCVWSGKKQLRLIYICEHTQTIIRCGGDLTQAYIHPHNVLFPFVTQKSNEITAYHLTVVSGITLAR